MPLSLDHHPQDGHRISGEPVLSIGTGLDEEETRLARDPISLRTAEALLRFFYTPFRSDAALPAVGSGSDPQRRDKIEIFPSIATPLELNERTVVCQDRSALGSNDLHVSSSTHEVVQCRSIQLTENFREAT